MTRETTTPGPHEPPKHDAGYKSMFADWRMVEQVLCGLFSDLARELDLSTLRRLPADFVMASGLLRRAGDRLWRVDFHDPQWAPLFVLLEFQSTPDPRMAWRILEYRTLALEEAVKQGVAGPSGLRPLFLAIVIYNGIEAWNDPAAGERPVPKNVLDYESPRLYRLMDMHRDGTSGLPPDNLVTAVVKIETMKSIDQLPRVANDVFRWGRRPGYRQAVAAIAGWFDQVVAPRKWPGVRWAELLDMELDEVEEESMLAETVKRWTEEWYQEGRQEGRQEGTIATLRDLVTLKFGAEVAAQLPALLEGLSEADRVAVVAAAVLQCDTGDEFIARAVRGG